MKMWIFLLFPLKSSSLDESRQQFINDDFHIRSLPHETANCILGDFDEPILWAGFKDFSYEHLTLVGKSV